MNRVTIYRGECHATEILKFPLTHCFRHRSEKYNIKLLIAELELYRTKTSFPVEVL